MSALLAISLFLSSAAAPEASPFPDTTTEKRAGYDWWSLQPVRTEIPPQIVSVDGSDRRWMSNPVDRFVLDALQEKGLTPSAPASPRALIRRATYGLTGLPPTPVEVEAFLEACAAETGTDEKVGDKAYATLVDRLLASPRYGEQWGRHWLDVARFGESTGFEVNQLVDNAWPYRDYVIRAFNEDKPFDEFIAEQLAGDSVAPGDPNKEIGLAFLVAGPYDIVGNQDPVQAAQIRANTVDEVIRAASEAFLGLTVGCARCHDHKFDPISQRDYYSFYATFAGVQHGDRPIATEAQRSARELALRPLEEKRGALIAEREGIENAIAARAEAKSAEYEAKWVREAVNRQGTEEIFESTSAKFVRLIVEGRDNDPNSRTGYRIDEFEVWSEDAEPRNVALADNGATARGASSAPGDFADAYRADLAIDGKYGARWIASGPQLTIELAREERIRRVRFSSDGQAALAPDSGETAFVCEYRIEVSRDGKSWIPVADSLDRKPANDAHRRKRFLDAESTEDERARLDALSSQLAQLGREMDAVPALPIYSIGSYTLPAEPSAVFLGGDPQRRGDEVVPASLHALDRALDGYALASDIAEQQRRATLARWISDARNPLTARVLVNRIWQYHFGAGIVNTPSDFGFMGERPTHPELLDWLAHELVAPADGSAEDAWRIKRIHRLIMLSQTYRQASGWREDGAKIDGDSRFLWRFPPRRLTGEEVRDTMLAIAGKLELDTGGPGFRLYKYLRDNVSTYVPLDAPGEDTYRRAVYHQNARASRVDVLTDFDSPDCALSAPKQSTTTSPLQALTLMNHQFTLDMAEALAERIRAEVGDDVSKQIHLAFELAVSRPSTKQEMDESRRHVSHTSLAAFCRAILNANELLYLN